ncbi:MAG: glycosyltransferase [Verrucomicrobia bacterium]|jgi:glycosyltransferase involved in cell wall biosynthesis|nr:glycosyltransferase [Verrucomicrobiota bacterium]
MQRVLHIVASMDPAGGGVAQAIQTIASGLRVEGLASEVVSVDDPASAFLNSDGGLTIHALGPGRFGWGFSRRLHDWLESEGIRFDIWIVHGLWLHPSYLAVSVAGRSGIPVHVYPHGMLDPWFQSWRRRPFKTLRNFLYWHLLEAATIRKATSLLFTCEGERRLAATTFSRYQPQAEAVVGLGNADVPPVKSTSKDAFAALCPEVAERSYLLFMGRLHPKKGIDLLLEGWAVATRGFPAASVPLLIIAGPGEDSGYGRALRKQAEALLPPGACRFPGMLSGDAKWAALRGAAAFVLFSHQENFGIAVAEALACGTPVLISDKVNIWREIIDRRAGWAASDSVASVAECLKDWLELAPEARNDARVQARATFLEVFEAGQASHRLAGHLLGEDSKRTL